MRILLTVATVALLAAFSASADAQGLGTGLTTGLNKSDTESRGGGAAPPQEKPTKPANEKDYKHSLDRLPDKKYDPWAKTR